MIFSRRDLAALFWAVVAALIGAAYSIASLLRFSYGGGP
jgi:hypothetical protein